MGVFPLLGVSSLKQAATPYAHPLIFLFLGGFTIALAAERWQLHRRMALRLMSWMGSREDALIGGFMLAGAVLSMWVSNTATAVTFLPVLSALALAADHHPLVLLIPATVAASCAFMMPVATPPNAFVFASGAITVPQTARAGLLLNLTAIPLVSLLCYGPTQLLFVG